MNFLVAGDFFIDKYIYGSCNRLSPEQPVPILNYSKTETNLGGAGNVYNNLKETSINTFPFTIISNDHLSKEILKRIDKKKRDFVLSTSEIKTISKVRVQSANHQLVRIDYEEINHKLSDKYFKLIMNKFSKTNIKFNFIIMSDYGKGFFKKNNIKTLLGFAKKKKIPTLIDPRKNFNTYEFYKGIDYITPNMNELNCIFPGIKNNDFEIENACKNLKKKYNLKNVIVTRGERGITFFNKKPIHIRSKKVDVFDVSGAGDTFVATFVYCISNKIDIIKSLKVANNCATHIVTLRGTQPIKKDKLLNIIKTTT